MPTPEELDDFQAATDDVRALLVSSLVAYWLENVQNDPANSVDELRTFILSIVQDYGQVAAATAIDFYNSVRPAGSPAFDPAPVVRADLVGGGSLNWATEPLRTETPEQSLDRIAAEIQKATMQAAIETLGEATQDDPLDVRYARWPQNPDPCAYCVLRASRGAVYWSESTAERGDHIKCGCRIAPIFPGERLPYQRKPYLAQYGAGRELAEGELGDPTRSPSTKAILAGMRQANGSR